jgi:hypothetical protein
MPITKMSTEAVKNAANQHLANVEEILSAVAMGQTDFDPVITEQLKSSYTEAYELLRTVSPLNEDGEIEYGEDI